MSFFSRKITTLDVDIHSHLIPNIDDGSQSMKQSIEMIEELMVLGFRKIITTPHIHPNYPNRPEVILAGLEGLQKEIAKNNFEIEIEAAAEYFVDEGFHQQVKSKRLILSFGGKHVLVESSFLNKPVFFESVMFDLQSAGYIPVLAHPERYNFLEGSIEWLEELKSMGVMLQVTLGSIGGYYGNKPEQIGKLLLKNEMVDFLGSDLHRDTHLTFLEKGLKSKEVQKSLNGDKIKNHQFL
ncbi:CpsB/CapC family capsule biosynthesis tyrosine phosphatase [Ekhidna sp.]|uniref:tyrosine-protein phosphatase n=1 Tax=Ekhidna sp. TaxID=2608089 RepID=UPI00329847F2